MELEIGGLTCMFLVIARMRDLREEQGFGLMAGCGGAVGWWCVWRRVGFMLKIRGWDLEGETDGRAGDLEGRVVQRRRYLLTMPCGHVE
jgi:hypothetical protein